MTLYSANETKSMVRKAAIGMGYDVGIAEDLGKAAVWLCARNFDGAKTALQSIAEGPSQEFTQDNKNENLIFKDFQIATGGPGIIDMAVSSGLPVKIEPQGVKSTVLLLGLAGITAADYGMEITIAADEASDVSTDGHSIRGTLPPDGSDLTITCQARNASEGGGVSPATAINCDNNTWNSLSKLAAKTYVPASKVSREKGAGAGLTDND